MPDIWRVALIDTGAAMDVSSRCAGACRFLDTGTAVAAAALSPDLLGHGTSMARILLASGSPLEMLIGQVFDDTGSATPAAVAAAIHWAIAEQANLIHMSLGLREDRPILAEAVAGAIAAGCTVIGSSPARGPATFPASYPGVIRATADARCAPHEISFLDSEQADYGACPRHPDHHKPGGASVGAAHLTSFIVAHVTPGSPIESVRTRLTSIARYYGVERKTGRSPAQA